MPLTEQQYQDQILLDVADDGTVEAAMPTLWVQYDNLEMYPRYLYVRVVAIDLLIAKNSNMVNTSGDGRSMNNNQVISNLLVLRRIYASALGAYSGMGALNAPEVTDMEAVYPIPGNEGWPDPNSQIYLGDPVAAQLAMDALGWPY